MSSPALKIISCSDPLMWYSGKIGEEVEFVRVENDCYISREDAGFLNVVKKGDAVIIQ